MYNIEEIKLNVIKCCPSWEAALAQDLTVQKMTGITNFTFKVTDSTGQRPPLIYRQFG